MFINDQRFQLLVVVLLGFVLTALFAYGHKIDGDVIQVLRNGHALVVKDILIPYGNASSSGSSGNVPGAFSSLAMGAPMLLYHSPWSALAFMALLHLGAFFMMLSTLRNFLSSEGVVLFMVLFWLSPWRLSEVFLWNPGYIFVASAMHLWTAFKLSKHKSFVFSALHGLSIFLALQIHASFVILVFITLILLLTRSIKPHILGTITGIALGLLSLAPYILAGLEDPSIFPQPGSKGDGKGYLFFGLVNVYPLLKGFFYWVRFSTPIFQTHMFKELTFEWAGSGGLQTALTYTWHIAKYGVGLFGLYISFWANIRFYKTYKEKFKVWRSRFEFGQNWIIHYVVAAFLATMIATAIAPTLPIYWHLLYSWPAALIPVVLILDDPKERIKKKLRLPVVSLFLALYFSVYNLFGALGSKKHDIRESFHEQYHKVCTDECRWPPKGE